MTQRDHRPRGTRFVVLRRQRTPEHGRDAQRLEEVPGDERGAHGTPIDSGSDGANRREDIGEDVRLPADRLEFTTRESEQRLRAWGRGPLDGKQLARTPHGIHAKEAEVVERERDGDHTEAEGHRCDDGERDKRCAAERSKRIEDVARQVIDAGRAAGVAALICRQRHRAEARHCFASGLGRAQAACDVLLRLAFDMKDELLVELPLDAARKRQRAKTQQEVTESHAPHASFTTRPMAADMRSHALSSIASCRRPDEVSR